MTFIKTSVAELQVLSDIDEMPQWVESALEKPVVIEAEKEEEKTQEEVE